MSSETEINAVQFAFADDTHDESQREFFCSLLSNLEIPLLELRSLDLSMQQFFSTLDSIEETIFRKRSSTNCLLQQLKLLEHELFLAQYVAAAKRNHLISIATTLSDALRRQTKSNTDAVDDVQDFSTKVRPKKAAVHKFSRKGDRCKRTALQADSKDTNENEVTSTESSNRSSPTGTRVKRKLNSAIPTSVPSSATRTTCDASPPITRKKGVGDLNNHHAQRKRAVSGINTNSRCTKTGSKKPTTSSHAPFNSQDEPLYCTCRQISFGDMIGCDNEKCGIEWFHFVCVGLKAKPKGKWYCPMCRGDKTNVPKPSVL